MLVWLPAVTMQEDCMLQVQRRCHHLCSQQHHITIDQCLLLLRLMQMTQEHVCMQTD